MAVARLMAEDISALFHPTRAQLCFFGGKSTGKFVLTHQTPSWRSQSKNTGDGWIKRKPEEEEEVTKVLLVSKQFYLIHNQAQAFPSSPSPQETAHIAHGNLLAKHKILQVFYFFLPPREAALLHGWDSLLPQHIHQQKCEGVKWKTGYHPWAFSGMLITFMLMCEN